MRLRLAALVLALLAALLGSAGAGARGVARGGAVSRQNRVSRSTSAA